MCQSKLAHPGYTRLTAFKVLGTKEGNVLVGHYISNKEKENDLIKQIFDTLWEEKQRENRNIEELVDAISKRNHVSITIEDVPRPETKKFEKPHPRKMYLFITKKVS